MIIIRLIKKINHQKINELSSKKEAKLAKKIAKTKLSIAVTYSAIYNSTKTIVQKVEKNKIYKIKSRKYIKTFQKQKYVIRNAINKVKSANKSCLDITDLLNQYNS